MICNHDDITVSYSRSTATGWIDEVECHHCGDVWEEVWEEFYDDQS